MQYILYTLFENAEGLAAREVRVRGFAQAKQETRKTGGC